MKNIFLVLSAFLLFTNCSNSDAAENNTPNTNEVQEMSEQLRHVVLFKFKDSATEADIKEVEDAFLALPSKIETIKAFEWGLNNSPEGLDKGFTHCFLLTFDSEEGRATYLPHPAH
ncbi:MAG: Dabb family protein, partial [Bacteroidetes bacterium]|nr:Dabb family protein [Bacteroidota bacterium]